MTIFFAITTVICGIGWLVRWINTAALLWYLIEKGYPEPTKEEWEACAQKIIRHLMKTAPDVADREQMDVVVTLGKAESKVTKDEITLKVQ